MWDIVIGAISVLIAMLIIYSVFFWMPGKESRKEERKENEVQQHKHFPNEGCK